MFFNQLLKLFGKTKQNKSNEHIGTDETAPPKGESAVIIDDDVAESNLNQELPVVDLGNSVFEPEPEPEPEGHPLQELANEAYRESGASFRSDIFPESQKTFRSSRLNSRLILTPSLDSKYHELCILNIQYISVGDYLKVKQNGVFDVSGRFICDLNTSTKKLEYRDTLKVESVFPATFTAPAYLKVEVVGYEEVLLDYIELTCPGIRTHDGQHLLSVARDFIDNNARSKARFGYELQLVQDSYRCYVVLYYGAVAQAIDIDVGFEFQGSDGCIVLGTLSPSLLSEESLNHMIPITDYYDRPHSQLKYLNRNCSLEILIEGGQVQLYVFQSSKAQVQQHASSSSKHPNSQKINARDYLRIENGKYRCSHSGEIFVSSWYFEKLHGVKLSDVDVLRAAQTDGIQHDKRCRIEFESAKKIWGEFVYMYPEKWLEQQSSRLW
ncbi:hypothetical protein AB4559_18130 [Vibrio sp. 10N.222.51.C8]|uniref:hypothetical protein n=1 Tax=Vibrio TaxID=662 RepID=UPI000C81B011|nr:hypothetical protein [Vibrio breoganii]PMO36373.1 hypothetical protein BCT12_08280 [Vibrio breoganii]